MERKLAWDKYDEASLKEMHTLADGYKKFLDAGKTERECVAEAIRQAKAKGYTDLNEAIASGKKLQAGDKVYAVCMNKAVALFNIPLVPFDASVVTSDNTFLAASSSSVGVDIPFLL